MLNSRGVIKVEDPASCSAVGHGASLFSVKYFAHCLICVYVECILLFDGRPVVCLIMQLRKLIMKLETSLEYNKILKMCYIALLCSSRQY